jgi:DNA modification methylase
MGEERAQAVITDPPYGVDYGSKNDFLNRGANGGKRISREITNDALAGDTFVRFLTDALAGAAAYTIDGGPIYLWHADAQGLAFRVALEQGGWLHKQSLVWVKNGWVVGRQDYQWKHEPVLYGWKPGAAHRWYGDFSEPTVLDDEPDPRKLSKAELVRLVDELRTQLNGDVVRAPKPTSSDLHPTMKPVALLEHFLWNSTQRGEVVLDPFAGSGSTLIAAEQADRRCFCLELDPRYCDVIRRRYEGFIGGRSA